MAQKLVSIGGSPYAKMSAEALGHTIIVLSPRGADYVTLMVDPVILALEVDAPDGVETGTSIAAVTNEDTRTFSIKIGESQKIGFETKTGLVTVTLLQVRYEPGEFSGFPIYKLFVETGEDATKPEDFPPHPRAKDFHDFVVSTTDQSIVGGAAALEAERGFLLAGMFLAKTEGTLDFDGQAAVNLSGKLVNLGPGLVEGTRSGRLKLTPAGSTRAIIG